MQLERERERAATILKMQELLENLTPEALLNLPTDDPLMALVMQSLAEDKRNGRLNWVPTGKQKLLVETEAFETLYGGGKGGGKSFALLAIARNLHRRSLILRRNFTELEGSLIDQSKDLFNRDFYNKTMHVWEFTDGVLIRFGHAQQADDVHLYDSSQYDLVGIDQVEQFTLPMMEYFYSILRTPTKKQRVRMILTANPVGENIAWVIERYSPWLNKSDAHPAKPGEVRWYARLDNKDVPIESGKAFEYKKELIHPTSRTFIPALVVDNPHLNPEYVSALQRFPEPLRSQLLYGLWDAADTEDPYQVIKRSWVDAAMNRWTEENPYPKTVLTLGVDVAAGGEDKTVLSRCFRTWFDRLLVKHGVETPDGQAVAQLVVRELHKGGHAMIDMNTWGSSAYDQLKNSGLSIFPYNGGESSEATDRSGQLHFANKRTEVWWKLREALDPANGMDIRLPPDDELKSDLCAPRWEFVKDKIRVEKKEDTRDRIGRSPDKGDAVCYAWSMSQLGVVAGAAIIDNPEYSIIDQSFF